MNAFEQAVRNLDNGELTTLNINVNESGTLLLIQDEYNHIKSNFVHGAPIQQQLTIEYKAELSSTLNHFKDALSTEELKKLTKSFQQGVATHSPLSNKTLLGRFKVVLRRAKAQIFKESDAAKEVRQALAIEVDAIKLRLIEHIEQLQVLVKQIEKEDYLFKCRIVAYRACCATLQAEQGRARQATVKAEHGANWGQLSIFKSNIANQVCTLYEKLNINHMSIAAASAMLDTAKVKLDKILAIEQITLPIWEQHLRLKMAIEDQKENDAANEFIKGSIRKTIKDNADLIQRQNKEN